MNSRFARPTLLHPLVAAASIPDQPGTRLRPLMVGLPPPDELLSQARAVGTQETVARALLALRSEVETGEGDALPTAEQLATVRREGLYRLLRWEEGARGAIDLLAAAGLPPPLVLKGGGTKYTLYPAPWLRTSADIDLLLPVDQVEAAARCLGRHGFELVSSDPKRPHTALKGHELTLVRGHCLVELHRAADHHFRPELSYSALSSRAVAISPLHPHALAPAPIDQLLLLLAHALKHGLYIPLRDLVDLALLRRRLHDRQAETEEAARALELAPVLHFLTDFTERLCSAPPGAAAVSESETARGYHELLSPPVALAGGPDRRVLADSTLRKLAAHLLLTPGWRPTAVLVGRYAVRRLLDRLQHAVGLRLPP